MAESDTLAPLLTPLHSAYSESVRRASGVGDRARSESERDKPRAVFRARGNRSQNQEYVSMAKNKFLKIKSKSLWQSKFLKIKSKFLWQRVSF